MGVKLPPDKLALYKRIDEILYREWDPIGVSDFDGPLDEYRAYLPEVYGLALRSNNPVEIADYLTWIKVDLMGMSAVNDHDLEIEKLILSCKRELIYEN